MLATIPTASVLGVEGRPIRVEVHVSHGLPGFTVVGLPDASCREARDRVRAAMLSSGFAWPQQRITVNLAPSGERKAGAGFDLAVAIGLLVACGELPAAAVAGAGFIAELGLDGSLRGIPGAVSLVDALETGQVVVAPANVAEARIVGRHQVRSAANLATVVTALSGRAPWPDLEPESRADPGPPPPDLADVRGQPLARAALTLAAAGGHHLLLVGPPGAGKTMLAQRLPGVLPPLQRDDALIVSRVHSAAGLPLPAGGLLRTPPFRAPHHGVSAVALIGGGSSWLRPGEISLAHGGVLFLDELGEFPPSLLDALRQPLEEGVIRVSRSHASATLPARFQLVAASNPCPCGQGGPTGHCRCSPAARLRYERRLSGPLLDRFDLRLTVGRADPGELLGSAVGETSAQVRDQVDRVRALSRDRQGCLNAHLQPDQLNCVARLDRSARRVFDDTLRRGRLTARGLHRVQRVARTFADLRGAEQLGEGDVLAALQLRGSLGGLTEGAVA